MSEDPKNAEGTEKKEDSVPAGEQDGKYRDLETLQREVEKRIRDNQRFLERFLDDDFDEVENEEGGDEGEETFEEL